MTLERLAEIVVRASLDGALYVAVVWLVCQAVPTLPARIRATLWWLACARLAVGLVWTAPLPLPVLPPAPLGTGEVAVAVAAQPSHAFAPRLAPRAVDEVREHQVMDMTRVVSTSQTAFALLWLAIAARAASRTLRELVRLRRRISASRPVDGKSLPEMPALAAHFGVERPPGVVVSDDARSPHLAWLGRAVIVLPSEWQRRWTPRARSMALGHELVHLRRHDVWWGLVPLAVERLFPFHPLARFASREYVAAREEACDVEVVSALGVAAGEYARMLVSFGVDGERGLVAAGASPTFLSLRRRLRMLEHPTRHAHASRLSYVLPAVLLAGAIPVQLVARPAPQTAPPPAASAAAPVTPEPASSARGAVALQVPPPAPPAPPAPPPPTPPPPTPPPPAPPPPTPPPPAPPAPPRSTDRTSAPDPPAPGAAEIDNWVLLSGDRTAANGWSRDVARARRARVGQEAIFWFTRDGAEYVIRDAKTISRLSELLDLQSRLAEEQARVAAEQATLGARQNELGARQNELGGKQSALGAKQAEASASAVDALAAEMDRLGAEMDTLGQQMESLGREMERLGQRQESFAREQEEAAGTFDRQVQTIVREALADGRAQKVR